MKTNNTSSTPSGGFTMDALQFSANTARPHTRSVQAHPNNYKSRSPAFQSINQLIVQLDAQFHQLPSTGSPSQAEWNAAVAADGYDQVCGCQDETRSGQTLYRMQNFWRHWLALAPTQTPIQDLTQPNTGVQRFNFTTDPGTGLPVCQIIGTINRAPYYTTPLFGRGFNNPLIFLPTSSSYYLFDPAIAPFPEIASYIGKPPIQTCEFDVTGYPYVSGQTFISAGPFEP